ncbi:HNH endonuclease [Pectobacterium parmentieri]|uniref:HNH endonuclease n=1 Tax=Pectobacterium parmentieri TaxID=1905730 RepID=UPI0018E1A7B7|nr:HNH endonuclease [Pectobacterium parmentieri]QQA75159.1 HNH endonuclease [Pectobacterium parmentieri]
MLKIKCYEDESFPFYQAIVKSKRNTVNKPRIKEELEAISDTQAECFESYDAGFSSNRLSVIEAMPYTANDKSNLQSLYKFRNKKIQELKNSLTKHPLHRENILNTCQNCTINEADTMDHILSQSFFPEFAVHPNNLFPCCSVCNRKKSDRYTGGNDSQLFLNLYLDDLPNSQYLHVEFGHNWLPHFWLEQPNDVPDSIFHLIESHYQQLDLLNRFRDSSNEIISQLKCTIRIFGGDRVQDKIDELCQELEVFLGYNHRKVVLYRALGRSETFVLECLEGVSSPPVVR